MKGPSPPEDAWGQAQVCSAKKGWRDLPVEQSCLHALGNYLRSHLGKKRKGNIFFFLVADSHFILVYVYHITDTEFVLQKLYAPKDCNYKLLLASSQDFGIQTSGRPLGENEIDNILH